MIGRSASIFGAPFRVARKVAHRTRSAGWISGWAAAKCHGENFYVRVRNKLCRSPRAACPCCGWQGHSFRSIDCGTFTVPQAECPKCAGHERHRMMHLFLERRPPDFMHEAGLVLHFAPEQQVRGFIEKNPKLTCVSSDFSAEFVLGSPRPGVVLDLHHLPFANGSADGAFCLHVLEHVRYDRSAIAELFRVLKPGRDAVVMVPFMMGQSQTIEYPAPDPNMYDHVRGYSPLDFKERLGPFTFEEVLPERFMSTAEIDRYKVPNSQVIYVCRKNR